MSQDRWDLVKELFHQALELPAEERPAFLQRIEEAAIREEVAALLRGEEESESFLRPRWLPPLDDFEILRELGNGGVGVVYLAEQKSLKRRVAIKVMRDYLGASEQKVLEFRLEPQRVASLNHPSIVPVYAVSRPEEIPYFIMEYIPGRSLKALLDDLGSAEQAEQQCAKLWPGPPSDEVYTVRVAQLMAEVADALHACHEQGLLHQDMKPGNILLDLSGEPHLVDFGVARAIDHKTLTGPPIGTPYYMSPEQAHVRKPRVDARSDVYSLGVVLYEMLTLERPFERETYTQIFRAIREYDPPPVRKRNPRVHPDLETICHQAMDKEANRRYETAEAFADDLRRFLDHEPPLAKPQTRFERLWRKAKRHPGRWLSGALVALALIIGWKSAEGWTESQRLEDSIDAIAASMPPGVELPSFEREAMNAGRALDEVSGVVHRLQSTRDGVASLRRDPELGSDHLSRLEELESTGEERAQQILTWLIELLNDSASWDDGVAVLDTLSFHRAVAMLVQTAELLPESEQVLSERLPSIALPNLSVTSSPPGAEVFLRRRDPDFGLPLEDAPGVSIGRTPIREYPVAPGYYQVRVAGEAGEGEALIRIEGAGQPHRIEELVLRPSEEVTSDMVLIPAGEFQMSPEGYPPVNSRGCPILSGTVPMEAYWVDRYEVSNAEYRQFLFDTKYSAPPCWPEDWAESWDAAWDRLPVAWVSLYDAQAYARWAGKRLLLSVEWQRAARGASGDFYAWGPLPFGASTPIWSMANLAELLPGIAEFDELAARRTFASLFANMRTGERPYTLPHYSAGPEARKQQWDFYLEHAQPVDGLPLGRNAEGLHHLMGNVSEWTESMAINEVELGKWRAELGTRIVHGPSWQESFVDNLLYTQPAAASSRDVSIGFRCAKSVAVKR